MSSLGSSSRGLISNLYRLAPADGYIGKEEAERRLRLKMRRLIAELGKDEVVRRIRAFPVGADQTFQKAWLVLSAEAEAVRGGHAQGSV